MHTYINIFDLQVEMIIKYHNILLVTECYSGNSQYSHQYADPQQTTITEGITQPSNFAGHPSFKYRSPA